MTYPAGLPTKQVSFGSAVVMEGGAPLAMRVTISASRSLVHRPSGSPLIHVATQFSSAGAGAGLVELPICDFSNMGMGDGTTIVLDAGRPVTHTYTALLTYYTDDTFKTQIAGTARTVGPFALFASSPSVSDVDDLLVGTPPPVSGDPLVTPSGYVSQGLTALGLPADGTAFAASTAAVTSPTLSNWAPSTAYAVNQVRRNPTGVPVVCIAAHTSSSTYDATKWSTPQGFLTFAGTDPAQTQTVKHANDTRPGVWELVNDSPQGTIFHLLLGVNSTKLATWAITVGGDNPGNGILLNMKTQGTGIKVEQNATVTGADSYGLVVNQKNAVAPASFWLQNADTAPAMVLQAATATDDNQALLRVVANGLTQGEVRSKTGRLHWLADIVVHDGGMFRARQSDVDTDGAGAFTGTDNNQTKVKHSEVQFVTAAGAPGVFYPKRILQSGQSLKFDVADNISGGPDTAPTYYTAFEMARVSSANRLGFFGTAPVTRPTGTPAAATDAATTQALANSLRASLVSLGLIA